MTLFSPVRAAVPLVLILGWQCAPARAQNAAPPVASAPNLSAPLTLEQSIAIALHNQGQPGAAQLQAQSAREGITSARAFGLPQITGSVGYNYLNQTVQIVSPVSVGAGNGNNAGVGTSVGNNGAGTGTNIGTGAVGTGTVGTGTNIGTGTVGTGTNFGSSFGTVNSFVSGTNSSTTTNIAVTQNIFDAGRTRQQVRAAQARSQSAVGSFGNARNGLAFLVAQRFYEQLRQEQLARQFEAQVALAAQQVAQVQAQIEAGTAARVDILSVQVTLRQRQFDLTTARNDLAKARVSFRNALGLARGPQLELAPDPELARIAGVPAGATPLPPINSTTDVSAVAVPEVMAPIAPPAVPALEPIGTYLAQAQRLRPDLVQARAAVAQNEAALALTRIEERPQIAASAGLNVDPRSSNQRAFNVGLGLTVPIFNGGGRRADTRAARDALAATRVTLTQTEKDADADVEASYTDVSGQVERIANARVLVEQAQLNLATATEKYRLGLGIILDIVNAQTQLFNAQVSATGATYDYELARAALDRSVGRFAWADPGEAPPLVAPNVVPVNLRAGGK